MEMPSEEEQIIRLIRKSTYEEVDEALKLIPSIISFYLVEGNTSHRRKEPIEYHCDVIKMLDNHYWTLEEYMNHRTYLHVLDSINRYNDEQRDRMKFLADHARTYFPNITITEVRINLND